MKPTREQLFLAATESVQRQGLSLAEPGRRRLLELIDQGVRRLESDGVSPDAEAVATALERIVEQSTVVHGSLRTIDAKRGIGEFEINAALRGLCPIYPFC